MSNQKIGPDEEVTLSSPPQGEAPARRGGAERLSGGRFIPGELLADRYRIVGLLGEGGMGEVYRAEDLKLGEVVSLKFLPERLASDPGRLDLLREEVRLARRVSHPHVCRVFDLGEVDDQHFLSMEFVDGEDLRSLLLRIGRLPGDKAAQIGRQICSGLAAAHDQGVLHRDLKPANIMVDGRGRAKIMDFGLAALSGEVDQERVRDGTPAYQAPEQRAGEEVTERSDLYALGAVLHEVFTGERPEANEARSSSANSTSLQDRVDTATERAILSCLEEDPGRRPASALVVAATLPGGDPIAAALAAGETPSPEAVAQAETGEGLSPALAWGALALFVVGLVCTVALGEDAKLTRVVRLEKPPEVLRERAQEILAQVGHEAPATDHLWGFEWHVDWLAEKIGPESWAAWREDLRDGQPPVITFSYRQSAGYLVKMDPGLGEWFDDPPSTYPGMAEVTLDPNGWLLALQAIPPERAPPRDVAPADWEALLELTALDPGSLRPVEPTWQPPVSWDERAAWKGRYRSSDASARLDMAALGGNLVALRVSESDEEAEPWGSVHSFGRWAGAILLTVFVSLNIAAAALALRNLRLGRGDRRGALRLAVYVAALGIYPLLGAHHLPPFFEMRIVGRTLMVSMASSAMLAVFYLALEPYLRRFWPHILVSWVRLLEGRLRDPEVGRAILAGSLLGVATTTIWIVSQQISDTFGLASAPPSFWNWGVESLRGLRQAAAQMLGLQREAIMDGAFFSLLLLVLRLIVRRLWLATPLLAAVWFVGAGYAVFTVPHVVTYVLVFSLTVFALFRYGLLALVTTFWITYLLWHAPLTFDLAAWYAPVSLMALGLALATALWGFVASVGTRRLISESVLEGA